MLIAAAILAAVQGGNLSWRSLVAAIATAMFYEWTRHRPRLGTCGMSAASSTRCCPALALLWIRERDAHGLELLMWVFIVTWSTDIGAYFTGRAIGKRKLAPSISPGKTVEGLYGGHSGGDPARRSLGCWHGPRPGASRSRAGLRHCGPGRRSVRKRMKRRAGIKDSGNWLPGHGGILDRLDGLVPVAVLTALAQLMGLT